MSNPIDKLIETCNIVGKECDNLVEARKTKRIDDIGFVNKYFDLVEKMPESEKKREVEKELDKYLKEVGEPTDKEVQIFMREGELD